MPLVAVAVALAGAFLAGVAVGWLLRRESDLARRVTGRTIDFSGTRSDG